jgi:hypothetical protein
MKLRNIQLKKDDSCQFRLTYQTRDPGHETMITQ